MKRTDPFLQSYLTYLRGYMDSECKRAVREMNGVHHFRARRLAKDTALVAMAEGGPDAVRAAMDRLIAQSRREET